MKTDRTKHPQCRFCGRTLENQSGYWVHRKSGLLACSNKKATPKVVPHVTK